MFYCKCLDKYKEFCEKLYNQYVPISTVSVAQFIAYLNIQRLAHSTIRSTLSGLNFIHQLTGGADLTQDFVIKKICTGAQKMSSSSDSRLPITEAMLYKLCDSLRLLDLSSNDAILFRAMFMLAFYGFLRVGEITVVSSLRCNPNLLMLKHVNIQPNRRMVSISFDSYKHKTSHIPFVLDIQSDFSRGSLLSSLSAYLAIRGFQAGPLFIYNSVSVTRNFFNSVLVRTLIHNGFDVSRYKTHSFRIGAATHSFFKGFSHQQIQVMGRWKSNAFLKYIRVQSFSS